MTNTQILKIMLAYRMGQTVAQISASQRLGRAVIASTIILQLQKNKLEKT